MDKDKKHKAFYLTTLIVGFLLLALEINIYQKTIIPLSHIIVVISLISVIAFLFIKNDYRDAYQNKSLFFPFAQSVVSFGFIGCYAFMALNFYFAGSNVISKSFLISGKHTIGTKNPRPAIEIDYEGVEKQLVFYVGQENEVDTSKYALLTVKKGLFGYDVLYDIRLK